MKFKYFLLLLLLVSQNRVLAQFDFSMVKIMLDNNSLAKGNINALLIFECNEKSVYKIINKPNTIINLNSIISSPSDVVTLKFYPSCNKQDIEELIHHKVTSNKLRYKEFYYIVSDTISTIRITGNDIVLIHPTKIQNLQNQYDDDLMVRIKAFQPIQERQEKALRMAVSSKDKDSIYHLTDSLFAYSVGKLNLDSVILPTIRSSINTPFSLYLMKEYIRHSRVYNFSIPTKALISLLNSMPQKQKKYLAWIDLKNTIESYSTRDYFHNLKIKNVESLYGYNAPSFVDLKDTSGNEIKLENYEGKILFVDFWASWCGPCIEQLPLLKKIYDTYKNKNVEFISISIDKNKQAWQKEINRQKMNWINISDLKGSNGITATKYNISMIPRSFLIDQTGKIVAEDVNTDQLSLFIDGLLNSPPSEK